MTSPACDLLIMSRDSSSLALTVGQVFTRIGWKLSVILKMRFQNVSPLFCSQIGGNKFLPCLFSFLCSVPMCVYIYIFYFLCYDRNELPEYS